MKKELESVPVIGGYRTLVALKPSKAVDNNFNEPKCIDIQVGDVLQTVCTKATSRGHVFFELNGEKRLSTRYHPLALKTRHPYDLGEFDQSEFRSINSKSAYDELMRLCEVQP